jgi:hypothetical protein
MHLIDWLFPILPSLAVVHFANFIVVAVWNLAFSVWSSTTWFLYWKYYTGGLTGYVAVITTVWFIIGGTVDLRSLFQRLKVLQVNKLDDGRVIGHMNADDYAAAQLAREAQPSMPEERAENPQRQP